MDFRPFLLLFFSLILSSCSPFTSKEKEPETQALPAPVVLHDSVIRLRLPLGIPRPAASFVCELPPAPAGTVWELNLLTPTNARNNTKIHLQIQGRSGYALTLEQSTFADAEESGQLSTKMPLPRSWDSGIMTLILEAELPVTFDQRVSVVARLKPA